MVFLVLAMVVCIGLAVAVVVLVAAPARREGRDMLGPAGERIVAGLSEHAGAMAGSVAERVAAHGDAAPATGQGDTERTAG